MFIKLCSFLVAFFSALIIFPTVTLAQEVTATPTANLVSEINPSQLTVQSPQYANLVLLNIFHAAGCIGAGVSPIFQPCVDYLPKTNAQGQIQGAPVLSYVNVSGGVLGSINSVMGGMYANKPLSTTEYLTDVSKGFGIIPQANAQITGTGGGTGTEGSVLSPVLRLWQVSRNMAYIALILVFIIVGLMVMFRNRVNPQTVISVQAAVPGLIVGLFLITFSYFLASLITDLAFVGTNVVGYYFNAAGAGADGQTLLKNIDDDNVMSIMSSLMNGFTKDEMTYGAASFFNNLHDPAARLVRIGLAIIAYQYGSQVGGAAGSLTGTAICAPGVTTVVGALLVPVCSAIGNFIGSVSAGGVAAVAVNLDPPAFIGVVLWVIALVVIIYTMFRLILRLINNYLTIIFLTITGPFTFLAASLPGRQGLATDWVRNMLCNVLAFPAVIAVLYFAAFLLGPLVNAEGGAIPTPFDITGKAEIAGVRTLPLFGGLDLSFINLMLAFGTLIATPAIPDIICRAIGKVGPAGQLLGQEISTATRGGRGYYSQATGGASRGVSGAFSGYGNIGQQGRSAAEGAARIPGGKELREFNKRMGGGGWGIFGVRRFGP